MERDPSATIDQRNLVSSLQLIKRLLVIVRDQLVHLHTSILPNLKKTEDESSTLLDRLPCNNAFESAMIEGDVIENDEQRQRLMMEKTGTEQLIEENLGQIRGLLEFVTSKCQSKDKDACDDILQQVPATRSGLVAEKVEIFTIQVNNLADRMAST